MTARRQPSLSSSSKAFTVIELLVAMSITLILLFVVNELFHSTSNAVSLGIATNELIANNRSMGDQLERDAEKMVGPLSNGFLAILNKEIGNPTHVVPASRTVHMPDPAGGDAVRKIRSDQLMFIIDSTGLESMTPASPSTYSGGVTAANARVWWGHVRKTNPDGTDSDDLGGYVDVLGNISPGENYIGSNWILGRQALFLKGPASLPLIYVDGARADRDVVGVAGTYKLYNGLTDVSNRTLSNTGEGATPTAIVGTDPTDPGDNQYLLYTGMPYGDYRDAVAELMFNTLTKRLRANPSPDSFTPLQIARTHPVFLPHVSDFIVEFAADTDNDGNIDTDSDNNGVPDAVAGGIIMWYSHFPNNPSVAGYDATKPVVYQPPTGAPYNWGAAPLDQSPYYQSYAQTVWRHDDIGAFAGAGNAANSKWPYLIRIRYRMHDANGKLAGSFQTGSNTNLESGKWFEHIIKVARP